MTFPELERITFAPAVMDGKPCIRGRISCSQRRHVVRDWAGGVFNLDREVSRP